MAPVIKKFKSQKKFKVMTVVSAQHRSMLDQVLKNFGFKSQIDLNVMKKNQSLFDITTRVMSRFELVLNKFKPDMVMVHGDTTTTLAGALAAFYKKIPVGHVEAGLRTRDKYQPFPEEMNRHLVDAISTLHFAPTKTAARALLDEHIDPKGIFITGNSVVDALLLTNRARRDYQDQKLKRIVSGKKFVLITAHRRENFGKPFESIFRAIGELSMKFPHIEWVYPVHPNPRVKNAAIKSLSNFRNVHLVNPVEYCDMVKLIGQCQLVLTDSGGLQEEAPALGKPVLVLRNVTERSEAVKAGTVRLVGAHKEKIVKETARLLNNKMAYSKMSRATNPYGDGHASERILNATQYFFKMSTRKPRPFK